MTSKELFQIVSANTVASFVKWTQDQFTPQHVPSEKVILLFVKDVLLDFVNNYQMSPKTEWDEILRDWELDEPFNDWFLD